MHIQKPRHSNAAKTGDKKQITAAERRFRSVIYKIRGIGRQAIEKSTQVDIANLINEVERYGFNFFPNHYVFDDIIKLEAIADRLSTEKGE